MQLTQIILQFTVANTRKPPSKAHGFTDGLEDKSHLSCVTSFFCIECVLVKLKVKTLHRYRWSIVVIFGAGEETRTLDIHLGKVTLYQLSYSRTMKHCRFNRQYLILTIRGTT